MNFNSLNMKLEQYREKKRQEYQENKRIWEKDGSEVQRQRVALKISRRELAKRIGFCDKTIARYEKGLPIRNRRIMEVVYQTGLECIALKRQLKASL